jgi:hypothetical protein
MDEQKIRALRDLIYSAQNSISGAKKILSSLLGDEDGNDFDANTEGLSSYSS